MNTRQFIGVVLVTLALNMSMAQAEGLRVAPTKLFFMPGTESSVLTLENSGTSTIAVQMEVMSWSLTDEGLDAYEPTSDIVMFPKILQVEPGEKRNVRIGYQGQPVGAVEKAYRLYVQELPVQEPGVEVMKFVMRIGVPVFARSGAHATEWHLENTEIVEGGIRFNINNAGEQHLMVNNLEAIGEDSLGAQLFTVEKTGWYVLPGRNRSFVVPLDRDQCESASVLQLQTTVDKEPYTSSIEITPNDCQQLVARAQLGLAR